ncbi:GNAT family N-acetyltransferase [Cysteiniphilum halobium]|uniref:GNAT family N-acetyltransferase n=1 Tax=Cysteiniphilum halobium TaxID=2219059 RepID=UPI000E64B4CD|nr:GNAT family N-acetyltransferase [Cysteiniphilum halobium]
MSYSNIIISSLDSEIHNRTHFCCGVDALDHYIQKQATQDIRRSIGHTFVATLEKDITVILGYYTLSTLSVDVDSLPDTVARKLPRRPIPCALIRRLAVSKDAQGLGVGRMLLVDAIKRTLAVSEEIAIYAMVVDAISEKAVSFYQQFGFKEFHSEARRLFLPLKNI